MRYTDKTVQGEIAPTEKLDRRISDSVVQEELQEAPNKEPQEAPNKELQEESVINDSFKYDLASSLIKDVRYSRIHIDYKRDPKSLKIYELYYNFWLQGGYYFFLWLNLGLIFIEEPQSFVKHIGIIPYYYVAIVNVICIGYFLFRWLHQMKCSDRKLFWNNKYNIATIVIIILMLIDIFIFVIMKYVSPNKSRFQWSRALRPFLCATFPENYKIRSALTNIKGTLRDILIVFFLFLFLLAFISLLGLQFLSKSKLFYPNGLPYFRDYFDIIFDFYVLVTTSNSPDVIIPAYENSSAYIIFYFLVTVICNWTFMGITVASVYNAYKFHLGNGVIDSVRKKKEYLMEAFDLLKSRETGEIGLLSFCIAMKKVQPRWSESKIILLFKLLDINKSNTLSAGQITKLTEFMHLKFEEISMNITFFKKHIPSFYWCYMSRMNQAIKPIIRSKYTKLFFEFLVLVNAISMIILIDSRFEMTFEWLFTFIFLFELCLRIFACGANLFFREIWNIFDFIIITGAVISLIIQEIVSLFHRHVSPQYLRLLLALRVLRLLKILIVIKSFRLIIQCIIILIPSLLAYTAVQFSIYYIYTCIGMETFGNLYFPPPNNVYVFDNPKNSTDCGAPLLRDSDFVKSHYCILNFNTASDGFLLMIILTVSNNWHILMTGVTLTINRYARLFFVSIHWFCVVLVMNIVLAFIIDAYLMEVESSKGHFEKIIENRLIEMGLSANEELAKRNLQGFGTEKFDLSKEMLRNAFPDKSEIGPVVFRLNSSTPRDMESLLQRMFEDDIEKLHDEFFKYDFRQESLFEKKSRVSTTTGSNEIASRPITT